MSGEAGIDPGGTSNAGILQFLIMVGDMFSEPLEKAEKHIETLKDAFMDLGKAGAEALIGYEAFKRIVEPAAAAEEKMIELKEAIDATPEKLEEVKRQAEALSPVWATSTEDILALDRGIVQYTGNLEDMMKITETAVKIHLTTKAPIEDTVKMVGAAFTNFRKTGEDVSVTVEKIGGRLEWLRTRFPGGASGAKIARDFGDIAAATKDLDRPVALDQMLALMAVLQRTGVALRGAGPMVKEMAKVLTSDKGLAAMNAAGIKPWRDELTGTMDLIKSLEEATPKQLDTLAKAFKGPVQKAIIGLTGHFGEVLQVEDDFRNSLPKLDENAKAAAGSLKAVGQNAANVTTNLEDTMGAPMLPSIKDITKGYTDLTQALKEYLDEHDGLKKAFAIGIEGTAFVLSIQGLISLFKAAIKVFGSLGVSLKLNPYVALTTATVIASYEIYKNWEEIKKAFGEGKEWLQKWSEEHEWTSNITKVMHELVATFGTLFDDIKTAIVATVDFILAKLHLITEPIQVLIGDIGKVVGWFGKVAAPGLKGSEWDPSKPLDTSMIPGATIPKSWTESIPMDKPGPRSYSLDKSSKPLIELFNLDKLMAPPDRFSLYPTKTGTSGGNVTQTITSSPNININVTQTPATPDQVSGAVKDGMQQSNEVLYKQWHDLMEEENRAGFGDSRMR